MKAKVDYWSVEYYPATKRGIVSIKRRGRNLRMYISADDERSISNASLRRALRVQQQMMEQRG